MCQIVSGLVSQGAQKFIVNKYITIKIMLAVKYYIVITNWFTDICFWSMCVIKVMSEGKINGAFRLVGALSDVYRFKGVAGCQFSSINKIFMRICN